MPTISKKEDRSCMNICFVFKPGYEDLQDDFFKFATAKGMVGIKGHRLVGGFRASCYNAMDLEGVQALVDCIKEYEASRLIDRFAQSRKTAEKPLKVESIV